MTAPRLCVALPVRNGADFLGAALESILAQKFTDFVLVVSDNASTDATPDILADAARRDPRILVHRTGEDLTQVSNMNRAVALSPSPWIKLFCHDDLMRADCLARIDALLDRADDGRIGLIGNAESRILADGTTLPPPPDGSPVYLNGPEAVRRVLAGRLGDAAWPSITTATVRRAAFDGVGGFDERFSQFDTFLWLHLLRRWNYVFVRAPITVNRTHPGQVAFTARQSLKMVDDYATFMPEFLRSAGDELAIPRAARLRMRLKPIGAAAKAIGDELHGRQWASALAMAGRLPARWWPLLAPLTLRSWQRDHLRPSLALRVRRRWQEGDRAAGGSVLDRLG